MFVILLKYKLPLILVDKYLAEHRAYLEECYKKNYLIVSGPCNPREGGVILSQLTDRAKVEEIIHNDPFYTQEVADYEIKEFSPVKFHADFAVFCS